MNVTLDPAAEQIVRRELDRSRFTTPEEVVSAGLQALDRVRADEEWWADVRRKVQVGMDELDAGLGIDGESLFAQLEREDEQLDRRPPADRAPARRTWE